MQVCLLAGKATQRMADRCICQPFWDHFGTSFEEQERFGLNKKLVIKQAAKKTTQK
jgi:hypothetical protein